MLPWVVSFPDVGSTVRAAAAGSTVAWAALVDEFSGLVWAVLRSYGLSRTDAEDAFQTTWMRFAEHLTSDRPPGGIGGWLSETAREEARKVREQRRLEVPVALVREDAIVRPEPPELLESNLEQADRALWEAFDDLRPMCKILLVMLSAEPALSYAEISAVLGIPIGSIGPTRQRCLDRLRRNSRVRALRELLLSEG